MMMNKKINSIVNTIKGMYRYASKCPENALEAFSWYFWVLVCLNTCLVFILPSNTYPIIVACFIAEILMLVAFVLTKNKKNEVKVVG